jgi:hypothetical protein
VLCGSLVAGCGTAARLDFKGHSRLATPVDVSVYVGGGALLIDPRRIAAGLIELNVTNQTTSAQAVSITLPDGRVIARTAKVEAGGTAQLKATLTGSAYMLEAVGRRKATTLLKVTHPGRTGNDALLQP